MKENKKLELQRSSQSSHSKFNFIVILLKTAEKQHEPLLQIKIFSDT